MNNEKTSENTNEYQRKKNAWFPSENENSRWPQNPSPPAPKRPQTPHEIIKPRNGSPFMIKIFSCVISLYRGIKRSVFPATCRFYPSCSEYSLQAFKKYGFFKGAAKTVWRLLRCSPLSQGGYDPLT
jgi:hypothetical protein